MNCPLCNHIGIYFYKTEFFKCSHCFGIYRNKASYISEADEQKHYECHNNDLNDVNYQKFVSPITNYILQHFTKDQNGLDFGCGTGPIITKFLKDKGYEISGFDPFFMKNVSVLDRLYDFIISCEVIEHFHQPYKEFENLRSMLLPQGALVCMTHIYEEHIDFDHWYYKNDPTHVFIYQSETIKWIARAFQFKSLEIQDRLVVFKL